MRFKPRRTTTIVFKNGVTYRLKADSVITRVGSLQGDLRTLDWKGAKNPPLHLDLTQVVAVVDGRV